MIKQILRRLAWGLAVIATIVLTIIFQRPVANAAPSTTTDTCRVAVVDQTTNHVLDQKAVTAGLDALKADGADVYVRAFESTPSGSLDAYYRDTYKACANWSSPDGITPKANLVVLMFSMDHESAIFYGSNFHVLDNKIDSIRATQMNANFKNGNFTEGITASTARMNAVINGHDNADNSATIGIGVLYVLLGILGGGMIIVALYIAIRSLRRRRQEKRAAEQKRLKQRTAALKQQKRASDAIMSADTEALRNDFLVANSDAPAALMKRHEKQFQSAITAINTASGTYSELQMQPKSDAEVTTLTAERYTELADAYKDIANKINDSLQQLGDLTEAIAVDRASLTVEARQSNLETIALALKTAGETLDAVNDRFDVAPERTRLTDLHQRYSDELHHLDTDDQLASRDAIEKLLRHVKEFSRREIATVTQAKTLLDSFDESIDETFATTQATLQTLTHVDISSTEENLRKATETAHVAAKKGLSSSLIADEVVETIDHHLQSIKHVAARVIAKDKEIQDEIDRKKRHEEERRRRERRYSSSYDNSASTAFGAGMLGGYLGSSMGRSHNSSSSPDYGGGSSGSFGGGFGGGGFGGGSSGGW